ncbi:MAG: DUF4255 domain-containing protein [Bacteroidota bacterium]
MIKQTLDFLVENLNEYILGKTGLSTRVKQGRLVSAAGSEVVGDGFIWCQLVNLDEERIGKAQLPIAPPTGSNFPYRNPEIKLNLCLLFSTNPKDGSSEYANSMSLLAYVIQYFQGKHHFTTENSPGLDPEIGTLIVELYPMSMENQNYLWGSLGAKYRPSVVYKVRLITVLDDALIGSAGAPTGIDLQGGFN